MSVIVETELGKLQGITRADYLEFRGIPYAQPPVGPLRFKAPQPLSPWGGVRKADRFSDASPQDEISMFGIGHTNEDCLYMNIWTPAADGAKRPVMVWIHGGGYVSGSGSQLIYRGRDIAKNGDVVVVTLNYRLGALGYLYLNEFIDEHYEVSANNGLLDQIAALKWIQNNIVQFGGDPSQVTLFGESAGGMSVAALMAAPQARGLFHKAVIQSGSGDHVLTRSEANRVTERFFEATEINPAQPEKLWTLDKAQIIKAQRECLKLSVNRGLHRQQVPQYGMTLVPTIDGDILPQAPITAIEDGHAADIPLLVSSTRDEWNLFLHTPGPDGESLAKTKYRSLDKLGLIKICERDLPGLGERSANLYEKVVRERNPDASYLDMYSAFESDRMFKVPCIRLAEAQSRHQDRVYLCSFDWDQGVFGACHAVDIPLVFGSVNAGIGQILTSGGEAAQRLSEKVQSCWIAFARSGNPATDEVGSWPGYQTAERNVMIFDQNCTLANDPHSETRQFWEGIL